MREIDVHGMLHSDAIIYVEDVILEESLKTTMFEVKVITGNSPRLQTVSYTHLTLPTKA